MKHLIIPVTDAGMEIARTISSDLEQAAIIPHREFSASEPTDADSIIFIGALGICVRSIAPLLKNKYVDPAIICIDSAAKFVIPVASGHIGGANELARRLAASLGATPVVTTQSDNAGIWALDTIYKSYGWTLDSSKKNLNESIFRFVNLQPTALLLDVNTPESMKLEAETPSHVTVFRNFNDIDPEKFSLIIAVKIGRAHV